MYLTTTFFTLICITAWPVLGLQWSQNIPSYGIVNTPLIDIAIDFNNVIATNNLSLGVQIVHTRDWISSEPLQKKMAMCSFKLIRIAVTSHLPVCLHWNETSCYGEYNWTLFDEVVSTIYDMGAELLLCINRGPLGMNDNWNGTNFPKPECFATYVADIARHCKENGWNVKYWEIWNEAYYRFFERWMEINITRLKAYVELFNSASQQIHEIIPDALCGSDSSRIRGFLNYFAIYGHGVGFLSFHKYDSYGTWLDQPVGYRSNEEILRRASRFYYDLTPKEMQQIWYETRGEILPVICSETNLNAAHNKGTDPRIQQPIGTVWYAEVLRSFIINNVKYSIYYCYSSNYEPWWEKNNMTGGYGFGILNSTFPHDEWYPFWLNYLIGNNLEVNDPIFHSSSTDSEKTSVVAWKRNNQFKVLITCKVNSTVIARLRMMNISINPKTSVVIMRIDSNSPNLQSETITYKENLNIVMNGYSVILLSFPYE